MYTRRSLPFFCILAVLSLGTARGNSRGADADDAAPVTGAIAQCEVAAIGPGARKPAEELAEYLHRISGAVVPICTDPAACRGRPILVGGEEAIVAAEALGVEGNRERWKGLSREGYFIRCSGGTLLLAGKTELATFYAVDRFLEEYLGVRWFMPGDLGEIVAQRRTLGVGEIEEFGEPGFRWRWVGRGEWARRLGMNVAVDCKGAFKTRWFVHTFSRLLPPEEFYGDHPEYYALVNGRRDRRGNAQRCTSNPQVARAVAGRILEIKKAEPDLRMISLDPMDTGAFCGCPACRALDEPGASFHNRLSRRLLLFDNAVSGLTPQLGARYPNPTFEPTPAVEQLPSALVRL